MSSLVLDTKKSVFDPLACRPENRKDSFGFQTSFALSSDTRVREISSLLGEKILVVSLDFKGMGVGNNFGLRDGGDQLLRLFKALFEQYQFNGKPVLPFRFGGDEFVVLAACQDNDQAASFLADLKARVAAIKREVLEDPATMKRATIYATYRQLSRLLHNYVGKALGRESKPLLSDYVACLNRKLDFDFGIERPRQSLKNFAIFAAQIQTLRSPETMHLGKNQDAIWGVKVVGVLVDSLSPKKILQAKFFADRTMYALASDMNGSGYLTAKLPDDVRIRERDLQALTDRQALIRKYREAESGKASNTELAIISARDPNLDFALRSNLLGDLKVRDVFTNASESCLVIDIDIPGWGCINNQRGPAEADAIFKQFVDFVIWSPLRVNEPDGLSSPGDIALVRTSGGGFKVLLANSDKTRRAVQALFSQDLEQQGHSLLRDALGGDNRPHLEFLFRQGLNELFFEKLETSVFCRPEVNFKVVPLPDESHLLSEIA